MERFSQLHLRRILFVVGGLCTLLVLLHYVPFFASPYRNQEGAIQRNFKSYADYELVVSHYDEPVDVLENTIRMVKGKLSYLSSSRVIIYHKGSRNESGLKEFLDFAEEVVKLENLGREGETYLQHIVRHYETATSNLAKHTVFLQPHLAWDWVIMPRLETITSATGFLSLGPYINMTRGVDVHSNDFPRINDIYSAFRGDFSPPHSVLATWAGQFVVSRKRILDNRLSLYTNLLDKFDAPPDHWIWSEGWHNNVPSNPTLGHALERSWPIIFGCEDASIAATCGEGAGPTCQCLD
ncbi:hypothetical protein P7C73_g83, partial [Tremellales sp. Uapishka_1]